LHSQHDFGSVSKASKIADRESLTMNSADAAARGLAAGDVVRVFNERGAFLAGLMVSDDIRPGVVQIATGAWYDPQWLDGFGVTCVHGNPNVLTRDRGTSSLAQGCSGHVTLVQAVRFNGELPAITVHRPPTIVPRA
jgi:biotin/methionine sulfoxide reductase